MGAVVALRTECGERDADFVVSGAARVREAPAAMAGLFLIVTSHLGPIQSSRLT